MDNLNSDITPQIINDHEFEGLQGHQGGSLNTVGTERYCKVQRMRFTMWISQVEQPPPLLHNPGPNPNPTPNPNPKSLTSKVRNKSTGEIHDELQYEQVEIDSVTDS